MVEFQLAVRGRLSQVALPVEMHLIVRRTPGAKEIRGGRKSQRKRRRKTRSRRKKRRW